MTLQDGTPGHEPLQMEPWRTEAVFIDPEANTRALQRIFAGCADLAIRSLVLPGDRRVCAAYLAGMVDKERLDRDYLQVLLRASPDWKLPQAPTAGIAPSLPALESHTSLGPVVDYLLEGAAILFLEGSRVAYTLPVAGWENRSIEPPEVEATVRGPQAGFIEDLWVNTAMLRRIIKSPHLKMEEFRVGSLTRSTVLLVYMDGLARSEVVQEARSRLARIDIDGALDTAYLEELIEDHPLSVFPQFLNTPRPDAVAANLLEGRFAIMLTGSPDALVAPVTWWSFFQSVDDYYQRFWMASTLRVLRFVAALLSVLLPSFYVAGSTFHAELIPTALMLTVARSREGIPFPAVVEALLAQVAFEMLREAGLRLPRTVGQAVSIVGALIIGEAAVEAGIIGAPMVIIVSTTGIASFIMPRYSGADPLRLLRFPFLLAAGTLGLYGIVICGLYLLIHLATLRSFGLPYLTPWMVFRPREWLDFAVRAPRWLMRNRPATTVRGRRTRAAPALPLHDRRRDG